MRQFKPFCTNKDVFKEVRVVCGEGEHSGIISNLKTKLKVLFEDRLDFLERGSCRHTGTTKTGWTPWRGGQADILGPLRQVGLPGEGVIQTYLDH